VPSGGPVEFVLKGSAERTAGQCADLSLGGMYVQTPRTLPFGSEVVVHVKFPGQKVAVVLPAVVRWTRPGEGMGLQFGLMGARETHAITEATRRVAGGRDASGKGTGRAVSS
jgi:Tfp pilus assembly protein PilZ